MEDAVIPTKGAAVLKLMNGGLEELRQLGHQAYEVGDIAKVYQPLGSTIELFLRSTALPRSSRRDNFCKLIDDLSSVGLGADEIMQLHRFRDHYNSIKHEPGFAPSLVTSLAILKDAHEALVALVGLSPGRSALPADRAVIHQLQVAFWDHYTNGDTEVAISLPSDHWTGASTLDVLYIRSKDWEALKLDLLSDSRFHLGKDHFAPEVWEFLQKEGDFLNAGIWEGSYRDLVRIIANFELRDTNNPLLPGLARENNVVSIGTALVMAAVEVCGAGPAADRSALIREILLRADTEYALSDSTRVREGAAQIADIVLSVPQMLRPGLIGPVLRAASRSHEGPLPVILEEGMIIFEF